MQRIERIEHEVATSSADGLPMLSDWRLLEYPAFTAGWKRSSRWIYLDQRL